MDKSEMKSAFEEIEKKLQGQNHCTIVAHNSFSDSALSVSQNKTAWDVLEEIIQKFGQTKYVFNGIQYDIAYYPSTFEYEVTKYSAKTIFDADKALSKKELTVRHFHGGEVKGYENPEPILDNSSILDVVQDFYKRTEYNIMILRHNTGDVTIWLDTKQFKQT